MKNRWTIYSGFFMLGVFLLISPIHGATVKEQNPMGKEKKALKELTLKDILSFRIPVDIALSPSGKQIALVVRSTDWEESEYKYELLFKHVRSKEWLTILPAGERIFDLKFSPDGKWLAFLTARDEDEDDEDNAFPQLWLWKRGGGVPKKVSSLPRGVETFEWYPDSNAVLMLAEVPHSSVEEAYKEHRKKVRDDEIVVDREKFKRAFVQLTVKDKELEWLYIGDYGIRDFTIHPEGKFLVFATNYTGKYDDEMKYDLWGFDLEKHQAWQMTKEHGPEVAPRFSPDGKWLAFLALYDTRHSFSRTDIYLIPFDESRRDTVPRSEWKDVSGFVDRTIEDYRWETNRTILATVARGVETHLERFTILKEKNERVVEFSGVVDMFEVSTQGNTMLAFVFENDRTLPDVWWTDGKGKPRKISQLNPDFDQYRIAKQEVVRWTSDEWTIEGIYVHPLQKTSGPPPLLVAIHGGPYSRARNTLRQYYYYQFFARHGYAVFAPNYRGSSGYGHKFGIANFKDLGGGDFRDIMKGVDALIERGLADADRLGVFGGSYGGYMTNWAITQTNRFKAAVSMFGIFNLITDFSNSYLPSWDPDYLGDYYWNDLEAYLKHSPFTYVKNIETPVLIIHGKEDPNTFISNSKEMYQALKFLKKTVEFVVYPREGHGLREPQHKRDEMIRTLRWFDTYIPGRKRYWLGDKLEGPFGIMRVARYQNIHVKTEAWENVRWVFELTFEQDKKVDQRFIIRNGDESDVTLILSDRKVMKPSGMLVEGWKSRGWVSGQHIFVTFDFQPDARKEPLRTSVVKIWFEGEKDNQPAVLKVKGYDPVEVQEP